MSISVHCDAADCDTWQREPAESFLTLSGQYGPDRHFCSLDCVLLWVGAHSVPVMTVEW